MVGSILRSNGPDYAAHHATPVAETQEPVGDGLCEEGACGELHLSEALRMVTRQLSTQQLNPRMPLITIQRSFKRFLGVNQQP